MYTAWAGMYMFRNRGGIWLGVVEGLRVCQSVDGLVDVGGDVLIRVRGSRRCIINHIILDAMLCRLRISQ